MKKVAILTLLVLGLFLVGSTVGFMVFTFIDWLLKSFVNYTDQFAGALLYILIFGLGIVGATVGAWIGLKVKV